MANKPTQETKPTEQKTQVTMTVPAGIDPTKFQKQLESALRGKARDVIRADALTALKKAHQGEYNGIYHRMLKDSGLEA